MGYNYGPSRVTRFATLSTAPSPSKQKTKKTYKLQNNNVTQKNEYKKLLKLDKSAANVPSLYEGFTDVYGVYASKPEMPGLNVSR